MKEKKIIYVLFDWATEQIITSTQTKMKALAGIGECVLCGDCVDNFKLVEVDVSEVEE